MNDDELATAVKESVTGVHMTIPADQMTTPPRHRQGVTSRRQ